ncbi:hypothetical protein [Ferrovibrio sp.]|uniref:hypothetical protein n=1 Tax=Ferrovibrio sp. TaxID=1917215 RepID=UPI001B56EB6C|nr:hypothetical protein [Ferrovibrio sp.]MBP7065048.1 hypothetical protein [Ferrovibrio sp.]
MMTDTKAIPIMMELAQLIRKHAFTLLRIWHAMFAGGYLVSYITADKDTYAMHQFSGYLVLTVLAVRLIVGLLAPIGHPLRLPRPSPGDIQTWLRRRRGRNPFFAWFAVTLLAIVGLAATSGAMTDILPRMEDLHEVIAESSLWLILAHITFVTIIYSGRSIKSWLSGVQSRLFGSG